MSRASMNGAILARRLDGEAALPTTANGLALLSKERLCRHVLVCGATGSGKTETVLRLAWAVARGTDAPVFYLDGKGDRRTAERFVGLMATAGRTARVFPNEPLDGWRGEAHELRGRLMEIVDYGREGGAAWYTDVAKVVVGLACEHPQGPPRSSRELLARMDLEGLKRAHGETQGLAALSNQQVKAQAAGAVGAAGGGRVLGAGGQHGALCGAGAGLRYGAGAGAAGGGGDGRAHRDGADPGQRGDGGVPPGEHAGGDRGAGGHARADALQPPRADALQPPLHARGATGEGTFATEERCRVDANRVRELATGEAYVISRGRAMRARILRAPQVRGSLPAPAVRSQEGVPLEGARSEKKEKKTATGAAGVPF